MNAHCKWRGQLDQIDVHLPKCQFTSGKIPKWFETYLQAKNREYEKEEEEYELMDPEIRDKIKEDEPLPLAVRLFNKS